MGVCVKSLESQEQLHMIGPHTLSNLLSDVAPTHTC